MPVTLNASDASVGGQAVGGPLEGVAAVHDALGGGFEGADPAQPAFLGRRRHPVGIGQGQEELVGREGVGAGPLGCCDVQRQFGAGPVLEGGGAGVGCGG